VVVDHRSIRRELACGDLDALDVEGDDEFKLVTAPEAHGPAGTQPSGGDAALDAGEHVSLRVDVEALLAQQVSEDRADGERAVATLP